MRKFIWCSSVVALMAGAVLAEDVSVTEAVVDSAGVEVTTLDVDAIESVSTEGEFSDVEYTTLEESYDPTLLEDVEYTTLEESYDPTLGEDVEYTTLEESYDPTLGGIEVPFDDFVKSDEECTYEDGCQNYELLSFSGVPVEGDAEVRFLSPQLGGEQELGGEQVLMMMSAGMVQRNNAVDTAAVPSFALDQLSAEQRTGERHLTNVPSKGRFNPIGRLFGRKAAPAANQPGTILQTSAIQMTPAQRDRAQQLAAIDRIRDRAIATGDLGLLKKTDRMAAELRTK